MKKVPRATILSALLLALAATPAAAIITFTQLDENTFTVSHRVKGFGSRAKATELVYTKAASLCVAAGFSHYQVLDQESQAHQPYRAANATLTMRFFVADGANRISCETRADPDYVRDAREKLEEQGYSPPETKAPNAADNAPATDQSAEATAPCPQGCTIEQIAAMARAGLSDEKIRAACAAGADKSEGNPVN